MGKIPNKINIPEIHEKEEDNELTIGQLKYNSLKDTGIKKP